MTQPSTPVASALPNREISDPATLHRTVATLALEAGFSRAGIAPVPPPGEGYPELDQIDNWIGRGYAGEMEYLKRRDQNGQLLRSSLRIPFPWVRSVIVCAANYQADEVKSIDPAPEGSAWVARYAWTGYSTSPPEGQKSTTLPPSDYHDVLLARLRNLERALQRELGSFTSRCYVDTGPVVERVYAKYAGIGWIGKNTCVLNQELGSWFFLGVILTDLDPPGTVLNVVPDRCGSCTRCIDACPTHALTAPREMDASLCISYLTIEKRGSIAETLRPAMGRQVFGCDICQDVCPWNRRAPVSGDDELAVRQELVNPALEWLADLDPESFQRLFRHSPMSRAKLGGLLRNVAIAMGNSGLKRYLPKLREWSQGKDPVLAEAALWATGQIEKSGVLNSAGHGGLPDGCEAGLEEPGK
jgi:epoxyqueuosine reductase